ncbi:MAG: bifunctional phosphoribosyl-AMP cyclohydrolase/phosphoribosyl-ATP diphosphatase HisIE [Clostridia bacterium]|nr:bifunctional phosphoribosyl-AMP cyclohydrolase/phosphoribosyl-ATP diphosphatase HisIE [Clostridia bacterium]
MKLKFEKNGLIPVVTQDYYSNEVLILSYMNQEAYDKTLESGELYYYSRSREVLWKKGETSGNTQTLISLTLDCDQDALLAKVVQKGAACHTGNRSCFYQTVLKSEHKAFELQDLITVIDERYSNPSKQSYTSYLFNEGKEKILKKIGEEATEVVIAAMANDKKAMIYEIADLVFHGLVLMRQEGLTIEEIIEELAFRSK